MKWNTFRTLLLKTYLKINNRMNPDIGLDDRQLWGFNLVKMAMRSPESDMMMAPISNTYYIKWKHIFIKISEFGVNIVNGKYAYDISLPTRNTDLLRNTFRKRLESKRQAMENSMLQRSTENLKDICSQIELSSKEIEINNNK